MNEHDLVEGLPEITRDVLVAVRKEGGEVFLGRLEEVTGDALTAREQAHLLRNEGLAVDEVSVASEVVLTPLGERVADTMAEIRTSGPQRVEAVRSGLLRWLDEDESAHHHFQDFVGHQWAISYGLPFTHREVERAFDFLKAHKFVKCTERMGGGLGHNPKITVDGRAARDSGQSIAEYLGGGSAASQTPSPAVQYNNSPQFHGSTINGSPIAGVGNTYNISVTVTRDERVQILSAIDSALTSLHEEGVEAPEAREAMTDLRQAVVDESTPPSTLREKLWTTMAAAGTTTVTQKFLEALPLIAAAL